MKKQNGITLIALVISIIIMLILAGVSINAIVGENGVLTRAQYSSFMNEMVAVEEAVQLWKAGELIETKGESNTVIPANGLCKVNDLISTERLVGEIGYYRTWSIGNKMPTMDVLSSAEDFNKKYEVEFIYYPAGVQDLYYLNNEALDLGEDKVYLIDAATSMIYSTTGITLNGVKCYSTSMAKTVMGNNVVPLFAESEVSGTGTGDKLAGNIQDEYLEDGTLNPEYNPYGFEIIASPNSDNIYKLYNNGELYAKGVKGAQLNSTAEEMEKVSSNAWSELKIPSEIGDYNKIKIGRDTIYVIDKNNELWAWGDNNNNKLGLTQEQQKEFTGRDAIKLNINNKKVKNVFDTDRQCFAITVDNELYCCGRNDYYYLGLGHDNEVSKFTICNVPNPQNISSILNIGEDNHYTLICYKDNTFYAAGTGIASAFKIGNVYTYFTPVMNGYTYIYDENQKRYVIDNTVEYNEKYDIDHKIKKVCLNQRAGIVLTNEGIVYSLIGFNNWENEEYGNNVKDISTDTAGYIILKNNNEVYAYSHYHNSVGTGELFKEITKVEIPDELYNSGIKEMYAKTTTNFYLANNGSVFASCPPNEDKYISNTTRTEGIFKLENIPLIESFYNFNDSFLCSSIGYSGFCGGAVCALGKDKKVYLTGNAVLLYRNEILQSSWSKIASNVKELALGNDDSIAYIDNENNVFVAGNSSFLGLNKEGERIINFVQVNDTKINGKARQIVFGTDVMLILTNEGKVLSTGLYSSDGIDLGWPNGRFPGWEEEENHYNFIELTYETNVIQNAQQIDSSIRDTLILTDNAIYGFGQNFYQHCFLSADYKRTPTVLDWSNEDSEISNIKVTDIKKVFIEWDLSAFILNNGDVIVNTGKKKQVGYLGARGEGAKLLKTSKVFNNEKVIDIALNSNAILFLTEQGNIYGYGRKNILGVNSISNEFNYTLQKLSITNVSQIVSGKDFFVAVKKDGTVWGTGSNQYGILGRWIGVNRDTPNSRYKTAFEWVECPELEI